MGVMSGSPTAVPEPRPLKQRILDVVPILLVGLGLGAVIVGFTLGSDGSERDLDDAIEELLPAEGSEVLRQAPVGIDLVAGYEADLFVNGIAIPRDQVNVLRDSDNPEDPSSQTADFGDTINRFTFSPAAGQVIEELPGDRNCARAEFWPVADPTDIRSVEWCFTVA
jgi:hypothetical protein